MVKSLIRRSQETKTITQLNLGMTLVPSSSATFVNNVIPLGPYPATLPLNQGVGQGARIGNVCKTVRLSFKGTLVPLPYNVTTNANPAPSQVKMVIFYEKSTPTVIPNPQPDFFQNGSTTLPLQNDLTDMWLPFNKDKYHICTTRTFKVGNSQSTGTGNSAVDQFYANNDFKYNRGFNIPLSKYYPKTVRFQDNSAYPERCLFACFYPVHANGGAYGGTQVPIGLQYMQEYRFKDA